MTRWYAPHLGQIHVFPAGSGKEQTSMSRRPEVRELLKQLAGVLNEGSRALLGMDAKCWLRIVCLISPPTNWE